MSEVVAITNNNIATMSKVVATINDNGVGATISNNEVGANSSGVGANSSGVGANSSEIVAKGIRVLKSGLLTEDDIHQWRYDTCKQIGTCVQEYTLLDIRSLHAVFPKRDAVITTMLRERVVQGYQLIFLTIDSSVVCNLDYFNIVQLIKAKLASRYPKVHIVLVDTFISLMENKFKIVNFTERYQDINIQGVHDYINFVESRSSGDVYDTPGIDFLYKVDFIESSRQLMYEEQVKRSKNEHNDNAQVALLANLKKEIPQAECVVFTRDTRLLTKARRQGMMACTFGRGKVNLRNPKMD